MSTGYKNLPVSGGGEVSPNNSDPDLFFIYATDFTGIYYDCLQQYTSGAAAAVQSDDYGVNGTENVFGGTKCQTGLDATGYAGIGGGASTLRLGGQGVDIGWRSANQTISDNTDSYRIVIGIVDNFASGSEPNNGVYFTYNHAVNGGRYECVTAIGGVRTAIDSGVALDTSFHVFEVSINEELTEANFYIDKNLVATATSGFPASSTLLIWGAKIMKLAGTTNTNFNHDWAKIKITRTSPR